MSSKFSGAADAVCARGCASVFGNKTSIFSFLFGSCDQDLVAITVILSLELMNSSDASHFDL